MLKLKSHIKPYTLIVGDFNTPLSPVERSTTQKLNREIRQLTDVMTQMNLTDSYTTFLPNTKEYTFFSAPHGPSLNLTPYMVIKQTSADTKNCNNHQYLIRSPWFKVRIQQQHNHRKPIYPWNVNSAQLNQQWVKEERRKEIKDFLEYSENEGTTYPNLWHTRKAEL